MCICICFLHSTKIGAEICSIGGFAIDNVVEVSPDDEDVEPAPPASKRLKKSKIPCTKENITKHFGRPEIDVAESFGCKFYSTFFLNEYLTASYIYKRFSKCLNFIALV